MDFSRYSRQIAVEGIGKEGQQKLIDSKVGIVGCGALGSMVAMQLAAAGVGVLGLADFDTVDISNLQRQFFYKEEDAGKKKAEILSLRIGEINSTVKTDLELTIICKRNIREFIEKFDVIVDATDNPSSKNLIDKVCEELGKPAVFAGVSEFEGIVMTCLPGTARFRDLFPDASDNEILPCGLAGVMGTTAAFAASLESSEVIKCITSAGELLTDSFLSFDLKNIRFNHISI